MQVNDTRLLRVKAVAEMFDVSVATIYRAVESGKLDALKIGSGRKGAIRIPESAVRVFMAECVNAGYQSYVVDGESPAAADDTLGEPATGADVVAGEVA